MKEVPQSLDELSIVHMRGVYQQIVVHPDLDATKSAAYAAIFTEAFGTPLERDDLLYWQLDSLTEDDRPPELETKATVSTPYSSDGEDIQDHSCQRIADLTKELLSETVSDEALKMKGTCATEIKQYCVQRSKNPNVHIDEIRLCLTIFDQSPTEDLQYALLHLFRHPDDGFKIELCTELSTYPTLISLLPAERLKHIASEQSTDVKPAMNGLLTP